MRKLLRERRGFTLTEMMVVILIVGLIAGIAAPPTYHFVQSNRLQTQADRLAADLQYARQVAVSRHTTMRFTSNAAGYEVADPVTGDVLRARELKHGMDIGGELQANFYPWGMADALVFNVENSSGRMVVSLLPTGMVEVQ